MGNWIWTHVDLTIAPAHIDAAVHALLDVLGDDAGWRRRRDRRWSAPGEPPHSAAKLALRLLDRRLGWGGHEADSGALRIDECEHTAPDSFLEEQLLARLTPCLTEGSEVIYEPNAEPGESGYRIRGGVLVDVESKNLDAGEVDAMERNRDLVDDLVRLFSRVGVWRRPTDATGRQVLALLKRHGCEPTKANTPERSL